MKGNHRVTVRLLGLLTLPACTVRDAWTPTQETCGLAEPLELALIKPGDDGERHSLVPPAGCADALLADLSADSLAMLDDLGVAGTLDEHVEDVRTGATPLDGLAVLVWGMYWLAGADLGAVGDLEESEYADPVWVEDFNRLAREQKLDGQAPLAQVLYNEVSRRVAGVGWFPDDAPEDAGAGMQQGTHKLHVPRPEQITQDALWPTDSYSPDGTAWGLVHESVHARLDGRRHIECASPAFEVGRFCDADLSGAYGAAFTVAWAQVAAGMGGAGCIPWDEAGDVVYVDLTTVGAVWSAMVLEPLPETVPGRCP